MNPYVLLLNPDAVIADESGAAPEACDLPGSAGAGGQLVDADGQAAGRIHGAAAADAGGPDFGSPLA